DWKKDEIARLKAEQGIVEVEEPAVNQSAGGFKVGGLINGSNNYGEDLQNEPGGKKKVSEEDE
ncbi:MAG: hypothetical protein SOV36_02490, partial [Anaerostipes faecalis]|nr:hypothetical protein [Anaerostipes faecalis]